MAFDSRPRKFVTDPQVSYTVHTSLTSHAVWQPIWSHSRTIHHTDEVSLSTSEHLLGHPDFGPGLRMRIMHIKMSTFNMSKYI